MPIVVTLPLPEPEPVIANVGNFPAPAKLPTLTPTPFIPLSIGNNETEPEITPEPVIANVGKKKKGRQRGEAVTVEPRVTTNGIGLLLRAAYWVDHDRKSVLYIQSTDLEQLRKYADQIIKWANSPNRRKPIPDGALKNLGLDPDSP